MERKLTKIVDLITQIKIVRSYKPNTAIIYTRMSNNDDIKQFQKTFHNDGIKTKVY